MTLKCSIAKVIGFASGAWVAAGASVAAGGSVAGAWVGAGAPQDANAMLAIAMTAINTNILLLFIAPPELG
jgi:hypothetical protein